MPKRKRIALESAEMTVAVKLADVPEYLQNGELFKSMKTDNDATEDDSARDAERIEVPAKFIKTDQSVKNVKDAWSLLHSLRYWIVGTDLPQSLVEFCLSPSGKLLPASFWGAFSVQFPHLDVLRRIATSRAKDPSGRIRIAISTGDVRLLRAVHTALQCLPATAHIDAVRSGSLACLQYVHEHGDSGLRLCVVKTAVEVGSVECLKYAVDHGYIIPRNVCVLAAKLGRLSCLRYLCSSCDVVPEPLIGDAAAVAGQLDCLKFAVEVCDRWWCIDTMNETAQNGHIACLAYMHDKGEHWDELTCSIAASADQLACLMHLHEHGCPWDAYTCMDATEMGSLRCLQYAHEHGCPWDARTCELAAGAGELACLEYAHEQGCPWDARTCTAAASAGELACLEYAHEHGCHWCFTAWTGAAEHPACEAYLLEHKCPNLQQMDVSAILEVVYLELADLI